MVTFQFKRSRKAPSKENHESFFKKEGSNESHFFPNTKGNSVQTKLTIGKPNDTFEREADTVVNHSRSDRNSHNTPSQAIVQRQEDTLNSQIQRQEEPKKEEVQTKPDLQLEEEPKKEEVQTKPETATQTTNPSFSFRLQNSKGRGNPLPSKTQAEMASVFSTDFSDVHIHTDQESVQMNRELKAQAFTHGKNIYFNQGKFDPDSVTGKHLLAHELTHVVQQNPEKHKTQ